MTGSPDNCVSMLNVSHSDVCMIIAKSSARNVLLLSTFDAAIYILQGYSIAHETLISGNIVTIITQSIMQCLGDARKIIIKFPAL